MSYLKKAFTLAEVIMVMGIIGIVGVLAVTNAKKDTDEAEKISQLRKCYEIISTAFATAVGETSPINYWGNSGSNIWNMINPYFKFTTKCGTGKGCWKNDQAYILSSASGSNFDSDNKYYKGILANGSSIAIKYCGDGCLDAVNDDDNDQYAEAVVDVNGPKKGLNKYGDDIFAFRIMKNGEVKPYVNGNDVKNFSISNCRSNGLQCTAWAIQFGNMDYFKANNSGTCTDGTTLSWDGNHTCRK